MTARTKLTPAEQIVRSEVRKVGEGLAEIARQVAEQAAKSALGAEPEDALRYLQGLGVLLQEQIGPLEPLIRAAEAIP